MEAKGSNCSGEEKNIGEDKKAVRSENSGMRIGSEEWQKNDGDIMNDFRMGERLRRNVVMGGGKWKYVCENKRQISCMRWECASPCR